MLSMISTSSEVLSQNANSIWFIKSSQNQSLRQNKKLGSGYKGEHISKDHLGLRYDLFVGPIAIFEYQEEVSKTD
jgi:hypothetical protein